MALSVQFFDMETIADFQTELLELFMQQDHDEMNSLTLELTFYLK